MKKGIFYIILSAFCFSCMNVLVRLSGDLPSLQKSFFRNLIAMLFAAFILYQKQIKLSAGKGNIKFLILRSLFGTLGIFCNFYAVDHLLVANASILNKLSPFFAILFSIFLLRERVKPLHLFCVAMAFIGCFFITRPGLENMNSLPSLIAVTGGMCAGIAYTLVRLLGNRKVPGAFIVFFFSAFSCLVTLPYMILYFTPMKLSQIICLLLAGLAAAGGQFAITAAYTHAPAREISIYDYSQILFATVLGFLLFREVPDLYSFIGYGIIIIASFTMFLYNQKKHAPRVSSDSYTVTK